MNYFYFALAASLFAAWVVIRAPSPWTDKQDNQQRLDALRDRLEREFQ